MNVHLRIATGLLLPVALALGGCEPNPNLPGHERMIALYEEAAQSGDTDMRDFADAGLKIVRRGREAVHEADAGTLMP